MMMMMLKFSVVAVAAMQISCLVGSASSFGIAPMVQSRTNVYRTGGSVLYAAPEHFDRAVECATNYGECDLNELYALANELEAFRPQSSQEEQETKRVKDILLAEHKFQAMKEEYEREQQLVSFPAEPPVMKEEEEEDAMRPYAVITRSSSSHAHVPYDPHYQEEKPQIDDKQTDHVVLSKKPEHVGPVPPQEFYKDAKDVPMDISHRDTYGAYARQLGYQGHDYYD